MIKVRPLIEVLGKIIKLPKNSYLDPTTLGSGNPSALNFLRGDSVWAPVNHGLYAQTGNSTPITATTVETSLLDGGVGYLSVPANMFTVGDSFHAVMTGHISAANNETIHVRIKTDSVLLADTGIITLPAVTGKNFKLDVYFTVFSIGAAGVASISSGGQFTYNKNASNAFEGTNFSSVNNTTFDTTITNTIEITAQWGSNNASNSIYSELFILNKIY